MGPHIQILLGDGSGSGGEIAHARNYIFPGCSVRSEKGLQLFVNFFFGNGNDGGLLNFTLGDLYQNFPYFGTAYAILQACGLGLVLAIAAVNLFKVFLGSLSKAQDTPTQILVRAALATVLIYLGGYLLSAVVGIAKVPYDIFIGSDAITHHFGIPDSLLTDLSVAVGVGAAGLLVSLVLIIAIAWNLIKLLLECVERYLMVGVLVYTSPLIYPFLSSAATATVFQRWVGMFCGECALMSLSVLFTKLSISALSSTSGGNSVIAKLIMCLTMCKIAQRVDSYMQQLGIGVPTTGEGILGNAMAVGYALKHAFGGAAQKASKGDALSGNNSTFGNLFRGKRAYNDAFAQGNSPADSRAARKAARDYAKTPAGDWGMNQFTPPQCKRCGNGKTLSGKCRRMAGEGPAAERTRRRERWRPYRSTGFPGQCQEDGYVCTAVCPHEFGDKRCRLCLDWT